MWFIYAVESELFRNVCVMIAVWVAIIAVVSNARTARKKQTADMIFSSRQDDRLIDGLREISNKHSVAAEDFRTFARSDKRSDDFAKTLRYVLNHYEYLSVSVQAGIYDQKMLRHAMHTTVVAIYEKTLPFINELRTQENRCTIFQEFEWLACKWKNKPLKPKKVKVTAI